MSHGNAYLHLFESAKEAELNPVRECDCECGCTRKTTNAFQCNECWQTCLDDPELYPEANIEDED